MKAQVTIPKPQYHCSLDSVAIFGSADVDEKHPLYQETFLIAQKLARLGKTIVNGGGPGVMDAATKGAQSVGGATLAVTFYPKDMPEFEGRYTQNKPDIEIKTANYIERMFGLMDHADVFVCMQGGTGTLSEWSTAWLLAHLYYGNHKPLVLFGTFWHEVMRVMSEYFFIGEKEKSVYRVVDSIEELERVIKELETDLAERCGLPERPSST